MRTTLTFVFGFLYFACIAQIRTSGVSYSIVDEQLHPIPNASVYFPKDDVLSFTDLSGTFTIPPQVQSSNETDSICFSAIGYESECTSLNVLRTSPLIILNEKRINLNEVVISGDKRKSRLKTAGNSRFSKSLYVSWNKGDPDSINNYQMAKHIGFGKDSVLLDKLFFHIHSNSSDSAEFLIEIFDGTSTKVGKRLFPPINKQIPITTGWNIINLTNHLFYIDKEVWVSIKFIPKKRNQALFYLSSTFLPSNDSAIKPQNQKDWLTISANTSFYIVGRKFK